MAGSQKLRKKRKKLQAMNTNALLPISPPPNPSPSPIAAMPAGANSMVWFRKGLRVHDNPALSQAAAGAARLFPVFVLDPHYLAPDPAAFSPGSSRSGLTRIRFLLESLADLDTSLRGLGSRLLVFHGDPPEVVIRLLKEWKIGKLSFEADSEPYAQIRDKRVMDFASMSDIEVFSPVSHTLFDPAAVIQKNGGRPPLSYQSFIKLVGQPPNPIEETISFLPPVGSFENSDVLSIPSIKELGYGETKQEEFSPFKGGESEALKRLRESLADEEWVANFEKPKGDPSAFLKPATTVLSPYLKFGCLSCRFFYRCLQDVYKKVKKHIVPPVSLFGQLLWREFFYTVAYGTPNFDCMDDNKICKKVPWSTDEELLAAWREGRTGYPWIDAIMVQLHKWGWMHHLARHCVACFLTRGDLFVHWEKGRDVFERLLVDHDWAINNGNWLWLSCSSFFYQYNRIYSPISFGKKYDPEGSFIRHFLPVLKDMPKEYIYEPWTAPLSIQTKAKCIIGKDYPKPVVDHNLASKECRRKMGEAYELNRRKNGLVTKDDLRNLRRKLEACDEIPAVRNKKKRSTIKNFPK